MIELPSFAQDRLAMADNRAIVVQVGDDAWSDEGYWKPFLLFFRRWVCRPRAAPGDKVLVTKFAGFMAVGTQDGQTYRLVNDRDIFCAIEYEGEPA